MTIAIKTININKVFIGIICLNEKAKLCTGPVLILDNKTNAVIWCIDLMCWLLSGADQGFLEKGFICIKGFALLILSIFFIKYPMKMK